MNIQIERLITADPTTVWQLISRIHEWDLLLPTVQQVTRVGPEGPVAVGSAFRLRQPGLPAAQYVVTEWRPDEGFTWESAAWGIRTVASHDLHTDGLGTRLRLGIRWTGPAAWLVRLLLTRRARRSVEQEAEAFALLSERAVR